MIRLKNKKSAEEKKPAAPAVEASAGSGAMEEGEQSSAPDTAEAKSTSEESSGGFKLVGSIGGKSVKQEGDKITGKKRTPGEIRVQKGKMHNLS
jgi:hypothetical protein